MLMEVYHQHFSIYVSAKSREWTRIKTRSSNSGNVSFNKGVRVRTMCNFNMCIHTSILIQNKKMKTKENKYKIGFYILLIFSLLVLFVQLYNAIR